MKARSGLWRKAWAEKLIKSRISPERKRNILHTDENLEVNQIPNKQHSSNNENKCVEACTIDPNIEQTTVKTPKFAANY